MYNQTAVNDSEGESLPVDFNLKDVTYTIEVEIEKKLGKIRYITSI